MKETDSTGSTGGTSEAKSPDLEYRRMRGCTRKRPFKTALYAFMFLLHLNECGQGIGLEVYSCIFCGEFHLGHPGVKSGLLI